MLFPPFLKNFNLQNVHFIVNIEFTIKSDHARKCQNMLNLHKHLHFDNSVKQLLHCATEILKENGSLLRI